MANTPVDVHQGLRAKKLGEPPGGFPPDGDEECPVGGARQSRRNGAAYALVARPEVAKSTALGIALPDVAFP